ncbi:MAG: UDP-N-acetylmuramoyl-tripeptide--D-alanyl-D-alanine ligase [Patescibacteria group bacterium]|nr:UDP-N-acetylmuramoyl-tripeptide--D-alanyl-D-alanine ligase [Patescibacteria group bacterium]
MKKFIQLQLKFFSSLILHKYQPEIIAISGSIGKTSTKELVYKILSSRLSVRTSVKNYNNEIGVPLTIIGLESPGSSVFGWLKVFCKALKLYIFTDKNYPKYLVLEMGIDRPGDMAYLTHLAPPRIGIMTGVSHSHLEYFGSLNNIKKEKQVLIENVDRRGLSILNYDNPGALSMAEVSPARVLTYGLKDGADLLAQDINFNAARGNYDIAGVNFKLNYEGSIVPVNMSNILSTGGVYSALAATAVALHLGFNLMEIATLLRDCRLPVGRMQLLPGIKHSFIIDDSYNSSPESSIAALEVLGSIKLDAGASRYAILGDMLEIGAYTEKGHRLVGEQVFKFGVDYLISVGERSRDIGRGAESAGMSSDYIFHFDDTEAAGLFVQERLSEGDVLLIKGSQGARMEKIVKEIMAEPNRAEELLVRQGGSWD